MSEVNKSGNETLLTLAFCIRMNIAADNCQAGSVYSENLLLMKDLCIGMYYCVSTKSSLAVTLERVHMIPIFLCIVQLLTHVQLFTTPRTIAHQAPLSVGFLRHEYWSGLPFPPPGDLPDPGIERRSPALAGRFFTTEPPGKPIFLYAFSEYYMSSLSGRIPSMAIQILSLQNLGYSMCHTVRVLLCTLELSYKPNQSLLPEVQIVGGQGD